MAALFEVVAGWTDRLGPFTLKTDGVPLNLTGYDTPVLMLRTLGVSTPAGGTVTVVSPQSSFPGQVTYDPIASDFAITPSADNNLKQVYTLHWKVVETATGKVSFFPGAAPSEVVVYAA